MSKTPSPTRPLDTSADAARIDCKCLRVVYAGTPEFAVPALQQLIDSSHEVLAVYTQPDRPAGRGRKLQHGPVKACAVEHGIEVRQPQTLRDAAVQDELAALQPDVIIVAAYGLILPPVVLQIPPLGCINIHASLLPRWRGAAPLQRSILAGDKATGITLMLMDEGLDTGAMITTAEQDLKIDMPCAELHDLLAQQGADTLLQTLTGWCEGSVSAVPQRDDGTACYAAKLEKSEAHIDWTLDAVEIQRKVMAFNPWPVAQTSCDGITLRLWTSRIVSQNEIDTTPVEEQAFSPGTVVLAKGEQFWVQTGSGVLAILVVQAPGKKPLPSKDFLNSRNLQCVVLGSSLADSRVAKSQATSANTSAKQPEDGDKKELPDAPGNKNV